MAPSQPEIVSVTNDQSGQLKNSFSWVLCGRSSEI